MDRRELLQQALDVKMGERRADSLKSLTQRERAVAGLVAQGKRNREIGDEPASPKAP